MQKINLITVREAAERKGVTKPAIIAAIMRGEIQAEKPGREYLVYERSLARFKPRKRGRPRKANGKN